MHAKKAPTLSYSVAILCFLGVSVKLSIKLHRTGRGSVLCCLASVAGFVSGTLWEMMNSGTFHLCFHLGGVGHSVGCVCMCDFYVLNLGHKNVFLKLQ